MDFIMAPLIVGIIAVGIYGILELFAHRKERLRMIEKMGSDVNPELLKTQFSIGCSETPRQGRSYLTIKIAGLMSGMGLGLLVAFFIFAYTTDCINNQSISDNIWRVQEELYGASVLLFGGLGLLVAFIAEVKMRKAESKK